MGMAEQLLMGAAAGMAHEGFIPFATTYAVFASRRAYDFIAQAIAEENLHGQDRLRPAGADDRLWPEPSGDRGPGDCSAAMPNLTMIDPCDALDIEQAVPAIAAHPGPVYMRLLRGKCRWCSTSTTTSSSSARPSCCGTAPTCLIVSSGFMTMRALEAADWLKTDRIDAARAARADDQAAG